jgi:hypothetical protein
MMVDAREMFHRIKKHLACWSGRRQLPLSSEFIRPMPGGLRVKDDFPPIGLEINSASTSKRSSAGVEGE